METVVLIGLELMRNPAVQLKENGNISYPLYSAKSQLEQMLSSIKRKWKLNPIIPLFNHLRNLAFN